MHPHETELALYAGGELGWLARRRVEQHIAGCRSCREEVAEFASLRQEVAAAEAGVPDAHWHRLAAEMKANIHLGLEAGACVYQPRPERRPLFSSLQCWAAYSSALAMIALALLLWRPLPDAPAPGESSQVVLAASGGGIELRGPGTSLRLLHDRSRNVTLSVSAQGAMRARFVDTETGQVTINNVYVQ